MWTADQAGICITRLMPGAQNCPHFRSAAFRSKSEFKQPLTNKRSEHRIDIAELIDNRGQDCPILDQVHHSKSKHKHPISIKRIKHIAVNLWKFVGCSKNRGNGLVCLRISWEDPGWVPCQTKIFVRTLNPCLHILLYTASNNNKQLWH